MQTDTITQSAATEAPGASRPYIGRTIFRFDSAIGRLVSHYGGSAAFSRACNRDPSRTLVHLWITQGRAPAIQLLRLRHLITPDCGVTFDELAEEAVATREANRAETLAKRVPGQRRKAKRVDEQQ